MKPKVSSPMEWDIEDGRNVFAERVIAARHARGFTQKELAALVGVSQQAITNIEKGLARSNRKLLQLADALGVAPEWLVGRTEDRSDRGESESAEPNLKIPLFTSREFRDAASHAWFAFNLSQIPAQASRNIDPMLFVGAGGAVGPNAMPDIMVQFSSQEYVALMREAHGGEHVTPPEFAAYILCCTSIAASSIRFGALPKLLFNLETRELKLADRWAKIPDAFMAVPYVMTIIT